MTEEELRKIDNGLTKKKAKQATMWEVLHKASAIGKGPFPGVLVPFGALVHFRATPAHDQDLGKFEPRSRPGIFLGYRTQAGGRWTVHGGYIIADLEQFKFDNACQLVFDVACCYSIVFG